MKLTHRCFLAASLGVLALASCDGGGSVISDEPSFADPSDPAAGATSFFSADGDVGDDSYGADGRASAGGGQAFDDTGAPEAAEGEGESNASVEEGDIYRVLGDDRILNLNAYRGLQVIDISDPAEPAVVGRSPLTGSPVELYVFADHAIVLVNGWRGYYGSRGDVLPEAWQGGLVVTIDLSDPESPTVVDRERVDGNIQTSRLVTDGQRAALYAVANQWTWEDEAGVQMWGSRTLVRSFSVGTDGALAPASQIDLGGYVQDIQATPRVLMVASADWSRDDGRSKVAVIDISSPDGTMRQGGEVLAEGYVRKKTDMDFYGDILRVVSGGGWRGGSTNHVETFDGSDLEHLERVDHATFGDDQDLYATLFLGNKAFFVTFLRQDPVHAFEIDDEGNIEERAEYVISGWNDFFKPVASGTRLIGVGTNNEQAWAMAVSLYDISDLSNPDPFIARAEVDASHSWSEASYDDRAFSVLEGAVAAQAADGTEETGLVLLPFMGWDEGGRTHISGVQIFTFSDSTLTKRGFMDHGTPVRRSFQAGQDMPANLSEEELSLFDCADPDQPAELGRVDLAPDYQDFLVFGDHGVRLHDTRGYWSWWVGGDEAPLPSKAEVVPAGGDPDAAEAVASVEVPAGSQLHKVGSLLAAVSSRAVPKDEAGGEWELETTVAVIDMSSPATPREAGSLVTRDLPSAFYGGWDRRMSGAAEAGDAMYAPGYYGGSSFEVHPVGDALVFVERRPEQELVGREEACYYRPEDQGGCMADGGEVVEPRPDAGSGSSGSPPPAGAPDEPDKAEGDGEPAEAPALEECSWISGGYYCRALEGRAPVCQGAFQRCTRDAAGETACVEVPRAEVAVLHECHDYDRYRYWTHFVFHVVDLQDPAHPALAEPVSMERTQEAVSLVVDGSDLWATWRQRAVVPGDDRPFVAYYGTRFDLSDPGAPAAAAPVNLPGELLAVDGDVVYTRDAVWGQHLIEAAVNRLRLGDGVARLEARRRFPDEEVQAVLLDGEGHVLVSHSPAGQGLYYGEGVARPGGGAVPTTADAGVGTGTASSPLSEDGHHLTVLAAADLSELSAVAVDEWATLKDARAGRALFQVPGGLLVMNLADAAHPFAQAYFPTPGWPSRIQVEGDDVFLAAGRFGVYRFGLDLFNLIGLE